MPEPPQDGDGALLTASVLIVKPARGLTMKLPASASLSSAALLFSTFAAHAHPGHVHQADGHSHWLTWGAAALAVGIAAGGAYVAWRRAQANR